MPFARRVAGLFAVLVVVVAGCSRSADPPPAAAANSQPAPAPDIDINGNGSLIRGAKGPVEPEEPPKPPEPRPGEIMTPVGGGAWPWEMGPAVEGAEPRPVNVAGVTGSVAGLAVSPAASRAVVFERLPIKNRQAHTRVVLADTAAGTVVAEWE